MKPVSLALVLALALGATVQAAEAPAADKAVVASISELVAAVNRGDQPAALAHFTPDATITEDVAPYRWQGPDAGAGWMKAMFENSQKAGMTEVVMTLGAPTHVQVEGDRAYAVMPGALTLKGKGQTLHATGVLTFALQKTANAWRIGLMSWGGEPIHP